MLRGHALADTTNTKYRSHWHQWSEFCRYMRWPRWLDGTPRANCRLHYFVIYLWRHEWNRRGRGNQYATIKLKLASVTWFHRRYQGLVLAHDPRLHLLLQGIKRLSDPVRKKQATTPAFLRQLRCTLNLRAPRQRLLWDSVLLAYFVLLRRSEYLVVGSKRSFYCLKAENVFFSDARGNRSSRLLASSVTIGLEGAKNDQYGRGAWRTMHASGDHHLCPVRALKHILDARRALNLTGSSRYLCADLTTEAVSAALKRTASSVGIPASHYATHSIRIGGATALLSGRADSLSIKLLGRRMSRCYEEYSVQVAAATTDLASRMV